MALIWNQVDKNTQSVSLRNRRTSYVISMDKAEKRQY